MSAEKVPMREGDIDAEINAAPVSAVTPHSFP